MLPVLPALGGAFEHHQGSERRRMPDDAVLHDAERLRERAKQARAIAHKRKDGGTKQLLMALAENFERLAELATNERQVWRGVSG